MARRQPRASELKRAYAVLDDLYAQLPGLECKGLCHDSCTAIDASEVERLRLQGRGVDLPMATAPQRLQRLIEQGRTPRCPALGPLNNCTVYDVRPFVCRAFGMVLDPKKGTGLLCEHGCFPQDFMEPQAFFKALRAIDELSVEVTGVSRLPQFPDLEDQ